MGRIKATTIDSAEAEGAAGAAASAEPDSRVRTDSAPAVVVFGLDESGKAHASRFDEADAELAVRAAGLMGYRVLRTASPDIATTALQAPVGRIFASGKVFRALLQDAAV